MKLADPSLLKDKCLVDGKWVGEGTRPIANPATGAVLAKTPRFGEAETIHAIEAAQRAFGPWAKTLPKERARILRRWFDLIIAKPRRHRPHHDQRTGQAACGSARRGRLRRRLHRVLRRGGEAHLWRGQSDLPRRFPHCRPQAADRRGRGDHAVEFPRRDDHPQGRARARRRLHRGGEARGRDAADRARAWRACATRRPAARRPQPSDRRSARDRQGDDRASGRARDRLHRLDRGRQGADGAGGGHGEEGRARARRQRAVHRLRRRPCRRRGRGRDRLEIPQHGPDLRLRQPHLCAGRDLRRLRRQAHDRGLEAQGRRRNGGRRDAGAAHQRGGGEEGRGACRRRCRRRARRS